MTTTIHPSPSRHPRWEAIKRSFTQSNYITDFWNWLMTLMSKAAELVLFGSVLYSGYQLLPNITHAPAEVDAIIFVIQQAALDIGGMGLLKLAKRAGLPKDSFPMRVAQRRPQPQARRYPTAHRHSQSDRVPPGRTVSP